MEDIEDLLVGSGGGVAPGFRLPVAAAVRLNPKQQSKKVSQSIPKVASDVPGTQVRLTLFSTWMSFLWPHTFFFPFSVIIAECIHLLQTIYIKTFGCSHNQVNLFTRVFFVSFVNGFYFFLILFFFWLYMVSIYSNSSLKSLKNLILHLVECIEHALILNWIGRAKKRL